MKREGLHFLTTRIHTHISQVTNLSVRGIGLENLF